MSSQNVFDHVMIQAKVTIRLCQQQDLPQLEWFGALTRHRQIIQAAYRQQQRGLGMMLVADLRGFPVGQVWLDLEKKAKQRIGIIWALRVFPWLRGQGLGRRLMQVAERVLHEHRFQIAELGVEDADVGPFYERLGYQPVAEQQEDVRFTTPDGTPQQYRSTQIVYHKELQPPPASRPEPARHAPRRHDR